MNALTRSSNNATPTLPALSPALRSLLVSAGGDFEPVQAILADKALFLETQQAWPAFHAEMRRASGSEGVRRVIGARFALYPQPARNNEEFGAWWSDYIDALEDVPEHALEAAMKAWIRGGGEFMPKPGQLLELARNEVSPVGRAYERMRKALEATHSKPPAHITAEPTPAQITHRRQSREQVKAMIADTLKSLKPPPRPKPVFKGLPADVTETGVSQALKDLVARRRGDA